MNRTSHSDTLSIAYIYFDVICDLLYEGGEFKVECFQEVGGPILIATLYPGKQF